MEAISLRAPERGGEIGSEEKVLAKFRNYFILVPVPFLSPGQSTYPTSLGGPVSAVVENALKNRLKRQYM